MRLVRTLGELGDWEVEPRGDEEVWTVTCQSHGLLLLLSLCPLEPARGDQSPRRWLLNAAASELGTPWQLSLDLVPEHLERSRPWLAAVVGFALSAVVTWLFRRSLEALPLTILASVVALGSMVGFSDLLRLALESRRSRQLKLLLAHPTVRKLLELLKACGIPQVP